MAMVYWKKGRVDRSASQIGDDGPEFKPGSKHRNKWVAVVEAEESADGRRHWITIPIPADKRTKEGKKAAQAWLANHLNVHLRHRAAGALIPEKKTVKDQCADYLEARGLGAKSREHGILHQFQAFKIGQSPMGSMLLTQVTTDHIQQYLNSKGTIKKTRKDGTESVRSASPGNAARHRITLNALFSSAEQHKPNPLIPRGSNPVTETPDPAEQYDDRRNREMKEDEQARMEPFLQNGKRYPGIARLGPIITYALYSLQREDEILSMRWRDIDFTERTEPDGSTSYGKLKVLSTLDHKTKDRESRTIELWPELKALLLVMRAVAMKEVGGLPVAIEDRHVFLNRDGKPYKSIRTSWENLLRKAGINDLHFHDLRRTGAMRYWRLSMPILTLSSMLGHGDIETTMRYLGKVGDEQSAPMNRAWARKQELSKVVVAEVEKVVSN